MVISLILVLPTRCHDAATGILRWAIPNAHRAPVTCCAVRFDASASFLVTGAEDGSVSVWDLRTRWNGARKNISVLRARHECHQRMILWLA